MPKIVHLSTSHIGGAGISARRLHRNLLLAGVQSHFVALAKPSFKIENSESKIIRSLRSRIFGALNTKFSKKLSDNTYITLLSVASIKANSLKKYGLPHDTIFHIHNWFNLINLLELKKLLNLGYKVVFTLHDQRLFTGGCHYSLDCSKFKLNCKSCPLLAPPINCIPELNLKRAKSVFMEHSSQLAIIAPSVWIQKLARESNLLKDLVIHQVTNVHGKLMNEDYVRDNQFTIEPRDKIFIGVASVEKSSNLKGGLILKEIEKLLDQEKVNAEVLYLSDLPSSSGSSNSFWTLIDYLLVPSILDNSPNVIHEAKILGIPVIATEVGGIGELLNSQYDYSVELNENTHHVVVEIIKKILSEKPKIHRKQIIETYEAYVSKSLEQIISIYRNL